jgi:hypothetical protein
MVEMTALRARTSGSESRDQRRSYEVVAERDGRYWFLRVAELPGVFSQVRRLDQADGMARDAIAAFLDVPPGSFEVVVVAKLREDLRDDLAIVGDLREAIERNEREYADLTRRLAATLVEREGLTVREAGRILGVSHQRVAQLVAAKSASPSEP